MVVRGQIQRMADSAEVILVWLEVTRVYSQDSLACENCFREKRSSRSSTFRRELGQSFAFPCDIISESYSKSSGMILAVQVIGSQVLKARIGLTAAFTLMLAVAAQIDLFLSTMTLNTVQSFHTE